MPAHDGSVAASTELRPPTGVRLALFASLIAVLACAAVAVGWGPGDGAVQVAAKWLGYAIGFVAAAICLARGALVRVERAAWLMIGAGLAAYVLGWVYCGEVLLEMTELPFPSYADALWLPLYPLSYVAFMLMLRHRLRMLGRELWLDGLIGAIALAAIGAAFVLPPLLAATGASTGEVAVAMSYALLDFHQFAFLAGVIAAAGRRCGRMWWVLAAAFAAGAAADTLYAYEAVVGSFEFGGALDLGWLVMMAGLAYAAWQPVVPMRPVNFNGARLLAVPAAFALLATALHAYGHFVELHPAAELLATATLVAAVARMWGAYREMRRLERDAGTDALTGLSNHRAFHVAVDDALTAASGTDRRLCVVSFDVDGFKRVNDARGHAEGDRVLREIGRVLAGEKRGSDGAFRTGGDEFALLLADTDADGARTVANRIQRAVDELDEGVGVSFGVGEWPVDGLTKEMLLLRADVALYVAKTGREMPLAAAVDAGQPAPSRREDGADAATPARREPPADPDRDLERAQLRAYAQDVRASYVEGLRRAEQLRESYVATVATLAAAVEAKDDYTGGHIQRVQRLGLLLAKRMVPADVDDPQLTYGFLLHDIGKLSVPDSVLTKPGKLTDEEWEVMRTHPECGVRILASVPFLDSALDVVRHHHERWDGGGYPAGLAGEEIPIWARIFAVVDTVDAITSDRPYRAGRPLAVAIDELHKGAGTQFDPACVEAFAGIAVEEIEALSASSLANQPLHPHDERRALPAHAPARA